MFLESKPFDPLEPFYRFSTHLHGYNLKKTHLVFSSLAQGQLEQSVENILCSVFMLLGSPQKHAVSPPITLRPTLRQGLTDSARLAGQHGPGI